MTYIYSIGDNMKLRIYFNDEICFNDEIESVLIGEEVSTTTSEFPYDNYYGYFTNAKDLNIYADVEVEQTHSDYDEYDPRTCRNGGGYGYDYYIVTQVHKVGKL